MLYYTLSRFLPALSYVEAVVRRCSVKKVFLKFRNIHSKTPALDSLFNKVAGLIKRDSNTTYNFDLKIPY